MSAARRRGLLRLSAVLVVFAVAIIAVVLATGGGDGSTPGTSSSHLAGSTTASTPLPRPHRLRARSSAARLPEGLSGEALVTDASGVLAIGGLAPSLVSTSGILRVGASHVTTAGALAAPLHDAAAATVRGRTLVFGGGSATTIDDVEVVTSSGSAKIIGHLPTTRSDLSAVVLGDRAYVLAGYDGSTTVASILETTDGRSFREVGQMAVPVRYAAVIAIGGSIYAFGGERADGSDTDAIQAIDPRKGSSKVIGHAPAAFSHASALTLGGRAFILGGRIAGSASDQVLEFDPATGEVKRAGHLPHPVTNAAAAASGGAGYLVGGLGSSGSALDSVVQLRLVP